jgi:hypothetical protein
LTGSAARDDARLDEVERAEDADVCSWVERAALGIAVPITVLSGFFGCVF